MINVLKERSVTGSGEQENGVGHNFVKKLIFPLHQNKCRTSICPKHLGTGSDWYLKIEERVDHNIQTFHSV